jgi:hypothetical protein
MAAACAIDFPAIQANCSDTTSEAYTAWLRQCTSALYNVVQYLDTANLIVYRQQAVLLAIKQQLRLAGRGRIITLTQLLSLPNF